MAVTQSLKLYQGKQDAVTNSSKLRILWTSKQTGESHNLNTRTAKYWVSINGGAEEEHSISYTLPKNKTQTILDVTIDVPHDDTGHCIVSVRTRMDTRISAGVVELSKEITLTPILRAHTISAQDAYIGGVLTVSVARKSADYYQSVHYQFGELSGYMVSSGGTAVLEERSKVSRYLFEIPDDWDLQILNAKTGICTLTCKTYLGTEKIGETSTKVTIKTDGTFAPEIDYKVVDINDATIALTGNSSRLIRGVSTAKATINATPLRGATIKSTEINGVQTAALEIEAVQNGVFTFRAVDSRGWETKQAVNLSIIPYIPLSAIIEAERGAQGSNALTVTIKGNYFNSSFGGEVNSLAIQMKADNGTWQTVTPVIEGNTYAAVIDLDLDYQTTHKLYFRIADEVRTLTPTVAVPKAVPTMMQGEDWTRFNGAVYNVPPRYASDADADETALEAWLDGLLAEMPNVSTMPVAFNCYPAVTGTTVFANLSKYTTNNYAVVFGASYDGSTYKKTKSAGVWNETVKE